MGERTPERGITKPVAYDYAKFPREFVSYRWFKPLLVALLAFLALGKKFGWFEPTGDGAAEFNGKKREDGSKAAASCAC